MHGTPRHLGDKLRRHIQLGDMELLDIIQLGGMELLGILAAIYVVVFSWGIGTPRHLGVWGQEYLFCQVYTYSQLLDIMVAGTTNSQQ